MNKIHKTLAVVISILFLSACSSSPVSTDLQTNLFTMDNYLLNPTQISQLMQDSTKAADLKIIDVRTPEEFATSCLKGAKVIDIRADDFDEKIAGLDKDAKYLVYCRSGKRSADAVTRMRNIGINNIVELQGGITAWQAGGFPVENKCS